MAIQTSEAIPECLAYSICRSKGLDCCTCKALKESEWKERVRKILQRA